MSTVDGCYRNPPFIVFITFHPGLLFFLFFLQGSGRGRDESERVKASEATGPVYIVLLWTLNIQPTPE